MRTGILRQIDDLPVKIAGINSVSAAGPRPGFNVMSVLGRRFTQRLLFLCSSSKPPGAGIHDTWGYCAAPKALAQVFRRRLPRSLEI